MHSLKSINLAYLGQLNSQHFEILQAVFSSNSKEIFPLEIYRNTRESYHSKGSVVGKLLSYSQKIIGIRDYVYLRQIGENLKRQKINCLSILGNKFS